MNNIIRFGNLFFSTTSSKLYDSEEEILFEDKKFILRDQLKKEGIAGSWEWLFLPFLKEKWLEEKRKAIFAFLKKIKYPLSTKG